MSLWVDKYRPTSLSKLDYHKDLATHLKKLVRELFTNISYDLLRHDGSSHFKLITSYKLTYKVRSGNYLWFTIHPCFLFFLRCTVVIFHTYWFMAPQGLERKQE